MKPMRTRVVRTIHPVGQGAFYSERFYDIPGGRPVFTVVYDCGSGIGCNASSDAKSVIKRFANNLRMERRPVIDILFISHFHSDHINGIKELVKHVKIKNIIMPYMKRELADKLQMLQDKIYNDENLHTFANPYQMFMGDSFRETHLIYVVSGKDDTDIPEADKLPNHDIRFEGDFNAVIINIDLFNNSGVNGNRHYIKSGNAIALSSWFYMPFTREDKVNDTDFIKNIEFLNDFIAERERSNPNHKWVEDKDAIKKIKEKYEDIDNNLNNTSMLVFSAPISLEWNNDYESFMPMGCHPRYHWRYCRHHCGWIHPCCHAHPSCLYTGDISLEKSICDLVVEKVQEYMMGAIQVPHHGSRNGWFKTTLANISSSLSRTIFFMSYGIGNKYRHPHKETITELTGSNCYVLLVNELYSTIIEQDFVIE